MPGPDAKAEVLLELILRLQRDEGDPQLKVLIFTSFVPTQQVIAEFLQARGIPVVTLNGSMGLDERRAVQREFRESARVLVSTDAGGEGLNLQFCHVVINLDTGYNPMAIEQRIGRVDRIGQTHTVKAFGFVLADSVEAHVRTVLEHKLGVILREFGVDKTSDVLDSSLAGQVFESLYAESLLHPDQVEQVVDRAVLRVSEEVRAASGSASLLGSDEAPDASETERVRSHPLPHWVERMVVHYLRAHGGHADEQDGLWTLRWPNGEEVTGIRFQPGDEEAELLTLEDPRVRGIATGLPRFAEGQPIPRAVVPDLPGTVTGYWSLWLVALHTTAGPRQRILPLFLHDNGRIFLPTARHLWDQVMDAALRIAGADTGNDTPAVVERLRQAATEHGRDLYDALLREHTEGLDRQHETHTYAVSARRRALERIGLPAVRAHRLRQLNAEDAAWRREHETSRAAVPELYPLTVVRIATGTPW
jgi:hypothetical protein